MGVLQAPTAQTPARSWRSPAEDADLVGLVILRVVHLDVQFAAVLALIITKYDQTQLSPSGNSIRFGVPGCSSS